MKQMARVLVAASVGLMLSISTCLAAGSSVHFGLGAGLAIPTGDLKDSGFNTGVNGRFAVVVMPQGKNLGIAFDAGYSSFPTDTYVDVNSGVGVAARYRAISGDVDALITVPTKGSAVPWVKFGVGVYNHKISADATDGQVSVTVANSETKVGFNGGVGVSFKLGGGKAIGLDAALHYVSSDGDSFTWIPLGVHFMFN